MLYDYGLQELAQHYGLLYALIPVLIGGIILGLIGAFGNEKLYWPSPERNKDSFKKRMKILTVTFIVLFFILTWYIFSFQFIWWLMIILIIGAIALHEPFAGRDSLISITHKKEIHFDLKYSFILIIFFLMFGTVLHGFQDMLGSHEETLNNQEKITYYIQNNDLRAFEVVEDKTNIDPLLRLKIYLHNLDDESIQAEAALLSRDIQRSLQDTDHRFNQFLFGVESFTRKKYKRAENIFEHTGYTNFADISKILNVAPLIMKTGIQGRYTLESDLVPKAVNKFAEEFESVISDRTPDIPKEEYVSNFKWYYWYNLMQSIVLFHVVTLTSSLLGAFLIRKTLKPEYKN